MGPVKTFRAIKIDPATQRVEAVKFADHRTARRLIGTDNLDHATVAKDGQTTLCVWVDGAGYYKPDLKWWRLVGYPHPLAGIGLIYGCDPMGETCDVGTPLENFLVEWLEGRPRLPDAVVESGGVEITRVDFNAPDAPTSMEETYRRLMGDQS